MQSFVKAGVQHLGVGFRRRSRHALQNGKPLPPSPLTRTRQTASLTCSTLKVRECRPPSAGFCRSSPALAWMSCCDSPGRGRNGDSVCRHGDRCSFQPTVDHRSAVCRGEVRGEVQQGQPGMMGLTVEIWPRSAWARSAGCHPRRWRACSLTIFSTWKSVPNQMARPSGQ